MNKICTTIEQSKKLLELGIDVKTADIYYTTFYGKVDRDLPLPKEVYDILKCPINEDKVIPAWSLTALYEILPNDEVTSTVINRGGWNIEPVKYLDIWFAEYETETHENYFSLTADDPIDAAFEMICRLKENGKL